MIDLHCHILPGIDDGAVTVDEAAEMCRLAAADGCEVLVATPHQRHSSWWNTNRHELESLRRQVEAKTGPKPKLLLGAEIRIGSGLLEDLDRLPDSGILPLAGSRYLLLEFDRHGLGPDPEWLVHELRLTEWHPIFAHPELIPDLASDFDLMQNLAAMGALFQVTAMSVLGGFGSRIQDSVDQMIDRKLVHFVASDAHGLDWRPPGLGEARDAIAERWDERLADRLTSDNPRTVIENRSIPGIPH